MYDIDLTPLDQEMADNRGWRVTIAGPIDTI
jgi:hypothetical protein